MGGVPQLNSNSTEPSEGETQPKTIHRPLLIHQALVLRRFPREDVANRSVILPFKVLRDIIATCGNKERSSSSTNSSTTTSNDSGFAVDNSSHANVLVKEAGKNTWDAAKYVPTNGAAKSRRRAASSAESSEYETNCKRNKMEE
ncbi:hypothetical protein TSAR_017067 [Trichomalopsis sarcophagae]|uniref:Uncharacterized protein n=1 Tax=Trichomalopsis sarcophagae TaxID=543379 RepID=A0A232EIH3_9HYME|nr:hypothetical protein TSAR_017067 [Trichomalopsis sarcophagae]